MEDYKKAFQEYLKEDRDLDNSQDLKNQLETVWDKALGILHNLENLEEIMEGYVDLKDEMNPLILLNTLSDDKYKELRFISEYLDKYSSFFNCLKKYGMSEQPVNEQEDEEYDSSWCKSCDEPRNISDENPYGTCQCS